MISEINIKNAIEPKYIENIVNCPLNRCFLVSYPIPRITTGWKNWVKLNWVMNIITKNNTAHPHLAELGTIPKIYPIVKLSTVYKIAPNI